MAKDLNSGKKEGNTNTYGAGGGEMSRRVHALDWSKTPVGAMESWPQSLKATIKLLLGSRYPMVLLWGEALIQIYNDAYIGLIGGKHPAALGRSIKETQAESWEAIGPMIHEVMSTGIPNWVPAQMLAVDRSGYPEETYFSLSYSAVENDAGIIEGMLCVCSEVTQQVLGERRLRLQRDLASKAGETRSIDTVCQDVVSAISDYPWDVPFALLYLREEDGTFTLRNTVGIDTNSPAYVKHIDLEANDPDPWSIKRAISGETVLTKAIDQLVSIPGGPWNEPVQAALTLPIPSSAQESPLGVLVAGISPNHALDESYNSFYELLAGQVSVALRNALAYEEERKRAEALAAIDRTKTAFFSNVSHEFRTPLTLMLGPLEDTIAASNKSLSETDREQLTTVYQNTLRLLKLVNMLLDFSRIEAKRAQAFYEPTDLCSFTSELASAFQSAIEKAGLKYEISCAPLSEPVYVDAEMWEKIVLNLISNALKFTFEGQITVALRETATNANLCVQDTGVGIPQEELPNLFKRFHRIQNSRSRSHEGTGIGLALVKELVEQHGGTIEVTSTTDKSSPTDRQGTTFAVSIPKGTAHLNKERIGAEQPAVATAVRTEVYVNEADLWNRSDAETIPLLKEEAAELQGAVEPDKNVRILLADDNADMLTYLSRILNPYWQVESVKNGVEALAAARREEPDLILSDVMMPNMNGFELLSEIRKDSSISHVPVLLLSARAGEEATIEGLEKGADDYLVKPFSARELLARVRTQLEIRRTRQDNTLLREAEEELKKFKIISDYAFDAFILMREDGTFAYLNDLALKRWGYTKEEAQHIRVPDVDPIYQEEKFNEAFAMAQKQGALPPFETIHKRKDGTTYPVEVSMGGIALEGKPHMFAVARDITERKLAEETLKARNEELQKTNNDLDNFIYTASHDLKAPITNIEGLVHMLVRHLSAGSLEAPVVDKVVTMMGTSIGRFKNTINDLTELTKLQRVTQDDIALVELSELFEEIRLDLETAIQDSGARLAVDFSQCPSIRFSKKNLRSIMYNLVSNAIKYHSAEREPFIRVSSKVEQDFCVLTVEDNGLGMDLSQESKIFSMFKRLHDHVEGSGIGLYIVKRIIENSGGEIKVESKVGKGSMFEVYLRCK
jgi:PAS domain S-box-containing protein